MLDLELVELDRANCCGAGVIAEHNQELADTLNARTFALAQQTGLAMMNICSTCQGAQSECQERLDANAAYRNHINEALAGEGLEYVAGKGGFTNKNFLWLLVEDIGLETLRAKVLWLSVPASSWLCSAITPAPQQLARSSVSSSMPIFSAMSAIEPCSSGVNPRDTQPGQ